MTLSLPYVLRAFVGCMMLMTSLQQSTGEKDPKNLLFLMFDDLRVDLNSMGQSHMITPNFDRLANRSVVFDHAYAQISVCNPSRDSILTGLRPDTVGTYGFQESFRPHMVFPTHLSRNGYWTSAFGKIFHWDGPDKEIWNYDQDGMKWYDYQAWEGTIMNSTTMPDKTRPIEEFRDYKFATRAIDTLKNMVTKDSDKHFMLAVGFKLPHLALHVPHEFYEMYSDGRNESWRLSDEERRFPATTTPLSYRCCAETYMRYMQKESTVKTTDSELLLVPDMVNRTITHRMRDELMRGYAAGITFVDSQLGRLLDTLDELKLWDNITIILTADHGMHHGEKGLWEKWSLFDESTHVPLMIYQPNSPFKGQHYPEPVELIDIFPTVVDLLRLPGTSGVKCGGIKKHTFIDRCLPLQGKSLAGIVMGTQWMKQYGLEIHPTLAAHSDPTKMFVQENSYAISQMWRCSSLGTGYTILSDGQITFLRNLWGDCNKKDPTYPVEKELALMGYSMRTTQYRYTLWIPFDKTVVQPNWTLASTIIQEELYDHRNEKPEDFTHREVDNISNDPKFIALKDGFREKLITLIQNEFVFLGPVKKMRPLVGYSKNGTVLGKTYNNVVSGRSKGGEWKRGPSAKVKAGSMLDRGRSENRPGEKTANLVDVIRKIKQRSENIRKRKEEKERATAME